MVQQRGQVRRWQGERGGVRVEHAIERRFRKGGGREGESRCQWTERGSPGTCGSNSACRRYTAPLPPRSSRLVFVHCSSGSSTGRGCMRSVRLRPLLMIRPGTRIAARRTHTVRQA